MRAKSFAQTKTNKYCTYTKEKGGNFRYLAAVTTIKTIKKAKKLRQLPDLRRVVFIMLLQLFLLSYEIRNNNKMSNNDNNSNKNNAHCNNKNKQNVKTVMRHIWQPY